MKTLLSILILVPTVLIAQDRCPSFKVQRSRQRVHYDFSLPVYRKEFPRKGNSVFIGGYASSTNPGGMIKTSINMPEYKMAIGWEASGVMTNRSQKTEPSNQIESDVFAATVSYFEILNEKAILEGGLMYGNVISRGKQQYAGLQTTISYRVWRDTWFSANVQLNNFQTLPNFRLGLATIIWNHEKQKQRK